MNKQCSCWSWLLPCTLQVLLACSGPPSPVIELPRTTLAGPLPAPGRRIVIQVDRCGNITCRGKSVTPAELDLLLREEAAGTAGMQTFEGPGDEVTRKVAGLDIVLHLDRHLPWKVAATLRSFCNQLEPPCWRFYFAVQHAATGKAGALAAFAPLLVGTSSRRPCLQIRLAARRGAPAGSWALPPLEEVPGDALVQVIPGRGSRVGDLLHYYDQVLSRGIKIVYFPLPYIDRLQSILARWNPPKQAGRFEPAVLALVVLHRQGAAPMPLALPAPSSTRRAAHPFSPTMVGNQSRTLLGDMPWWEEDPPAETYQE